MAAPTLQAVGTPNNSTANVTFALPAHQAGDILMLVIECAESAGVSAPAGGWAHVTNSPRPQGSNVTCLNVLWKRASASTTPNPTVTDPGNHMVGFAYVVRGCITYGDPFDFAPVDSGANNSSLSAAGGTTNGPDRLVAVNVGVTTDTTSDQLSSVTNSNLSGFGEAEQSFTTSGNGGGVALYTGSLASAGATGTTTGTKAGSDQWASLTLAFVPDTGTSYAGPTVQAVGSNNSGTSDVQYAIPTHQANDILVLLVETPQSGGVSAPSGGWAHVTGSPVAGGVNITALNVMWLRASSGSTTDPTVSIGGNNHQTGYVVVFRGCVTSGDPWDFTPTTGGVQSTTSFTLSGDTTTGSDRLVVTGLAGNLDQSTDLFFNVQNNTLANFVEREQNFVTDGDGGGVAVFTGEMPSAGATGSTTGTMASSTWAGLTLALKPASGSDATISASTVAVVASVGAVSASGDANASPTVVAGSATVGSSTVSGAANVSPSGVAAVASVGSATVSTQSGANISASVVAGTTTVGSVTTSGGARPTPAVVASVSTMGTVTTSGGAGPTPSVVSAVASVGSATVSTSGNVNVTPSVVAGAVSVGAANVSAGALVTPSVIPAVGSVGSATVSTAGNVNISAVVVSAVGSVGAVTASGGARPTPSVVAASAVVGTALPSGAAHVLAAVVQGAASIGSATVTSSPSIPAVTVSAVTALAAVVVRGGAAAVPLVVPVVVAIGPHVVVIVGPVTVGYSRQIDPAAAVARAIALGDPGSVQTDPTSPTSSTYLPPSASSKGV